MTGFPTLLYSTSPVLFLTKTSFLHGQITPSDPAIKPTMVAKVICLNFFKTKLNMFENITRPEMEPRVKITAS